jgi:hypothetical protein
MARSRDARQTSVMPQLPSAQELAIMRNREYGADPSVPRRTASGRSMSYSMTEEAAIAAASLMDRTQVISPLAGLPVSASSGDFAFAKAVLGSSTGEDGLWDDYWEDSQEGYDYANLAGSTVTVAGQKFVRPGTAVTSGRDRQPAPITLVPTSTINPERPRTVAAGYDPRRQVLTVVFRDGTFYNYYDVDSQTWVAFKAAPSKGRFIASNLDYQPRGTANMSGTTVFAREQAYRVARTGQLVNDGQPQLQIDRSLPPRLNPTTSRRPPKNGMRRKP